MQQLWRGHLQNPGLALADHFDLIAGMSTGAIIATCLSWGMDEEDVLRLYVAHGKAMFQHVPW